MNRLLLFALACLIVGAGLFAFFFHRKSMEFNGAAESQMRAAELLSGDSSKGDKPVVQMDFSALPLLAGDAGAESQFLLFTDLASSQTPHYRREVARAVQSMGSSVAVRELPFLPETDFVSEYMDIAATWKVDEDACRRVLFKLNAAAGPEFELDITELTKSEVHPDRFLESRGQLGSEVVSALDALKEKIPGYGCLLVSDSGKPLRVADARSVARFVAGEVGGDVPLTMLERPLPHPSLAQPCISVNKSNLRLGDFQRGQQKTVEVKVTNAGNDNLVIDWVGCEFGVEPLVPSAQVIPQNDAVTLSYTITAPDRSGPFVKKVRVHSNDPSGVMEVSFAGTVLNGDRAVAELQQSINPSIEQ